jgi:hypothetical protein
MKLKTFAFALACSIFTKVSIFAALPPFAEDKRIVIEILKDEKLANFIPYGDVLVRIEKYDDGYLLTTNKRAVLAIVHYESSDRIGPRNFNIEFQLVSSEDF